MSKINIKEKSTTIHKTLAESLGVKNVNALPKLKSVNLNVGLGQNKGNKDMVAYIVGALSKINGQKPFKTRAKKTISRFKIRTGDEPPASSPERSNKMYDF